MIYISIDNDQHSELALSLINKLCISPKNVVFISHISPRNRTIFTSQYRRIDIDGHPLSNGSGYIRLVSYIDALRSQRALNERFAFSANDILWITTEYQLNNAFLAKKMKRANGKVYLFDEGLGFYCNNSSFHKSYMTPVSWGLLKLYNLSFFLLGIPAYARKGFDDRMYVCIRDTLIDRIYSRMRLPIDRPIEVCGYKNTLVLDKKTVHLYKDRAIFFANNLSRFGLRDEEICLSSKTIKHMASVFCEVLIKVHPSDALEQNSIFYFYKALAMSYQNVRLLDNTMIGTEALGNFRPKIAVGTLGTAMFDAFFLGCQPVFLFHLLPEVREFGVCRQILNGIDYQFVPSITNINPEYQSGVDTSSLVYEDKNLSDLQI